MWDRIIAHFDPGTAPLERLAFLVGGLLVFWILEGALPRFLFNTNMAN